MKYEKSCGCIIIKDGKVLLVKQQKGHWDFPKGHVEKRRNGNTNCIKRSKRRNKFRSCN